MIINMSKFKVLYRGIHFTVGVKKNVKKRGKTWKNHKKKLGGSRAARTTKVEIFLISMIEPFITEHKCKFAVSWSKWISHFIFFFLIKWVHVWTKSDKMLIIIKFKYFRNQRLKYSWKYNILPKKNLSENKWI